MSDFLEQQQQPFGEPGKPLKREHDSTDDFEHVEHELHNNQQQQQQQPVLPAAQQLLDLEPPQPHNLQDGLLSRTDLLDTSVPAAASGGALEADLQPVPATPPPSANSEKFIEGARGQAEATPFGIAPPAPAAADELEARLREQIRDSKAATMAFMQAEKSTHGIAKSFDDDDAEEEEEEEELSQDSARQAGPPPPAVPSHANVAAAGDADDESLKGRSNPAYDSEDDEDNTRSEPSEPIFKKTPDANLLDLDNNDELEEFDVKDRHLPPSELYAYSSGDFVQDIKAATLPEPEKSPELDFVKDEIIVHETKISKPEHEPWNVLEKTGAEKFEEKHVLNDEPPSKPLPPLPKEAEHDLFDDFAPESNNYNSSNEFLLAESKSKGQLSGGETGDSEFESEPEPSPAKVAPKPAPVRPELGDAAERKVFCAKPDTSKKSNQVTPGALFSDLGIDAWFNPERLNPKVASLIYWRDPKKSGIVFGAALGVLLSLAYFSLISVIAYISLLTLTGTVAFRIYKTVQQAIQKTSDGHPFKDLLDLDLALPTEKVHEVADIAVANVNAALSELRRLFLVEDIVDSLKFGILLWSLTYLGAWFNGMTLIIIGVVALFTLPKVYETNKTQIDANLALVQARINEITAKVKAAVPIGSKKAEPAKEE